MTADPIDQSMRILILPPTRKDGEVTSKLLAAAGIACEVCRNPQELANEIRQGAGALIITERIAASNGVEEVVAALATQETWSDLPIIMLLHSAATSPATSRLFSSFTNLTLLERPAPTYAVMSAVQSALRARRRQYEIQRLLESEQAARIEGERANRMKDEFLATLSHELRTPLSAISGWVQLLKMNPADAQRVTEAVEVIDRNVRVQTQLIEDLLDMSRIISGKIRLDVQSIEISAVIAAAIEAVLPAVEAKEIRLENDIDPGVGVVSGDFGRLQQILWNLLTNAVKYTPKHGRIHVQAKSANSHVEVSVSDSGEGIPPEFLPHLFERFSQADGSITRRHGGLGLGLSIVKHLVELHGGTVQADSAGIGKGSTFVISLPLRVAKAPESLTPHSRLSNSTMALFTQQEKLRGIRVLVIDDEPDAREFVKRLLADAKAIPIVASAASEGLHLLEEQAPDVIVSDIGMPEQDGYEFIRQVRERAIRIPAIALTAFARSEDRIRSIEAGYQAHLPKPVEPAELLWSAPQNLNQVV